MRFFAIILFLGLSFSHILAQDTIESPVDSTLSATLVPSSEMPVTTDEEDYLSRYLKFFDKNFDATTVLEDDENYAPLFEGADSVFEERLKNISSPIHLPYNEKVRRYIEVYITQKRMQTKVMLALSKYYFPIFERELAKQGLPEELKYVAIIESALNPRAMSRMGAGGLWQFIYRTGKAYGLRIDKDIDERFDAEKATVAAVTFLKDLYREHNDWTLAIAAYNCGSGNVRKAIRRAKNKKDYWEIYNYLPRETRGYLPAFIGATYAMTYYREHGISVSETEFPEVCDTLMISQELHFSRLSQFSGAPMQTILNYNPQYKSDFIPQSDEPFVLKLPANYILKVIEYKDTIFAPVPKETDSVEMLAENKEQQKVLSKITYRVKRGDNLSLLAVRFEVKVDEIKDWNELQSDALKVNQNLTIYTTKGNVRDLSGVVAVQNAEKAKAAELAAAQASATPATTTKPQNKPATSTSKPATSTGKPATTTKPASTTTARNIAATNPAQKTSAQQTTASPTTRTPARTQAPTQTPTQTRPTTIAANRPRTTTTAPARITTKAPTTTRTVVPTAKPQSQAMPLKSATRNMQSRNVAVIQSKNAKNATTGKFVHYKVKSGETLFAIQRKHPGSNIQEIINMNNLRDNGNKIYPNQVLKIRVN